MDGANSEKSGAVEPASEESFDQRVLRALCEGFRARAGAKERHQALSEYEIARRAGFEGFTYVEFDESDARSEVRSALARLQRVGQARAMAVSGKYETFVPSERALEEHAPADPAPVPPAPAKPPAPETSPSPTTIDGRLDEMVRLLRSIDERLRHIEKA